MLVVCALENEGNTYENKLSAHAPHHHLNKDKHAAKCVRQRQYDSRLRRIAVWVGVGYGWMPYLVPLSWQLLFHRVLRFISCYSKIVIPRKNSEYNTDYKDFKSLTRLVEESLTEIWLDLQRYCRWYKFQNKRDLKVTHCPSDMPRVLKIIRLGTALYCYSVITVVTNVLLFLSRRKCWLRVA